MIRALLREDEMAWTTPVAVLESVRGQSLKNEDPR